MAKTIQKNKFNISDLVGYIAIILIVVSLFFIGMKVTGYVTTTDTAVVNVTVASSTAINFTTDFIDFGSGTVNATKIGATINTEGSVTNGTWAAKSTPLILENIGNTNVSLTLSSSQNALDFIGGTSPSFKIKVSDKDSGACGSPSASAYTELTTSNLNVCGNLQFLDSIDEINVNIQLYIPYNSGDGARTATITATGTSL